MRINGKKMKMLLNLIKENKKEDLGHLSKGLEIEDKNGTKYTILKIFKNKTAGEEEDEVESLEIKYYDTEGRKKKRIISKEEFLKLFKIEKKKSKKTLKGSKDD